MYEDNAPTGGTSKSKKKKKPTTSYGDEHRSPTTPSTTSSGGTAPSITAGGLLASSAPTVVPKPKPTTSYGDDNRSKITSLITKPTHIADAGKSVYDDRDSGQAPTAPYTVTPTHRSLRTTSYGDEHRSQITPPTIKIKTNALSQIFGNPDAANVYNEDLAPAPSEIKPPKTFLQTHPQIAEEWRRALEVGDTVAMGNILDDKLQKDINRLSARTERRHNRYADWLTDAEIAVEAGDLDWAEDNPANPKWTKAPSLTGINSQQAQRDLYHELKRKYPENAEALEQFFSTGIDYSRFDSGMMGIAHDREKIIRQFTADNDESKIYFDRAFKKAAADEKEWDNWTDEQETEQDAERREELATAQSKLIHPYVVERDDNGNPIAASLTKRQVKQEIALRTRLGIIQPYSILSMLENADVLIAPQTILTPEQQKRKQQEIDRVVDAAAEDEQLDDAIGGSGGYNPVNMAWHSANAEITKALHSFTNPAADTVHAVIDKATRPLNGLSAMSQAWSAMDEESESQGGWQHNLATAGEFVGIGTTYHALTGKSAFDSVDDVTPGKLWDVAKAGGRGTWDGGLLHNLSAEDQIWGEELIKYNADRDGVENIYDKHWYQVVAGFGHDVVFDPTMYVTGGPLKKVGGLLRSRHLGQDLKGLDDTAGAVTNILEGTSQELTHTEVRDLLGGNWGRRPTTHEERILHMNAVGQGVRHLRGRIDIAVAESGKRLPKEHAQLEYYGKIYRDRFEKVVGEHEDDTLRELIGEDFVDHSLDVLELAPHMPGLHAHLKYEDEVARRMNFFSAKGVGDARYVEQGVESTGVHIGPTAEGLTTGQTKYGSMPKLLAYRATLEGDALKAFDEKVADVRAKLELEGMDQGTSVESVFGPKFEGGAMSEAERGQIYKDLRAGQRVMRAKRIPTKKGKDKWLYHAEDTRLYTLNKQLDNAAEKLRNAKPGTRAYVEAEEALKPVKRVRDRQQTIVNRMQAEHALNAMSSRDSSVARTLVKARSELQKVLDNMGGDEGRYISTTAEQTRGESLLDVGEDLSSARISERPDSVLGADGKFDMPKLLEPDPANFGSKREQIEHFLNTANRQIADLESRDVTTSLRVANLVPTMPAGFLTKEGKFNWDEFIHHAGDDKTPERGFVSFDEDKRLFHVTRRMGESKIEVDAFVQRAVDILNDRFHSVDWKNVQAAGSAREAERLTPLADNAWQEKLMNEGVTPEDVSQMHDMFDGGQHGPAVVPDPRTGERLIYGKDTARFEELASKADKDRAASLLHWFETSKAGDPAPQMLVNEMRGAGYAVPGNKHQAAEWFKKNQANTRLELQLDRITARRIFKGHHNMSIGDAKIHREHIFDDIVGATMDPATIWGGKFTGGVSLNEFLHHAMRSKKDFHDMFASGPFNFHDLLKTSERGAREAVKERVAKIRPKRAATKAELNAASVEWSNKSWKLLQQKSYQEQKDILTRVFERSIKKRTAKSEADRGKFITDYIKENRRKGENYKDYQNKVRNAGQNTKSWFESSINRGVLNYHPFDRKVNFGPRSADKTMEAVTATVKNENMAARTEIREAIQDATTAEEKAILKKQLEDTIAEWHVKNAQLKTARAEAAESANVLKDRLGEEAILRAGHADLAPAYRQMQLGVFGQHIPLPGSQALFAATDKISGFAGMKGSRNIWQKIAAVPTETFKPPSKVLNEAELNRARSIQVNNVPNIIEHAAKGLVELFGTHDKELRTKVMGFAEAGNWAAAEALHPGVTKAIHDSIQPVVDTIGQKVGKATFTIHDLNRRLPQGVNLSTKTPINTVDDFFTALREGSDEITRPKHLKYNQRRQARRRDETRSDPWALAWEMMIAKETALGDLMMYQHINEKFGRERGWTDVLLKSGKTKKIKRKGHQPGHDVIEKLMDEPYNWKPLDRVPESHRTHLFPPEMADKINIMFDMLSPKNVGKTGEIIQTILRIPDVGTSFWKAGVTMYNPGFYTRNGIGEVMSSWLHGVNTPKPYIKADKTMRAVLDKDFHLQSLLDAKPWAKHLELGDKSAKGADVALTMQNGRKVTHDDLWVGFSDEGLNTGYFNTEFGKQGRAPMFGENPVGRAGRAVHNKVRQVGENYEDWLRLAHYIDVIEKSTAKTFEEASAEAARMVRKAHFDYTDFSPFEKAVMLRLFPFYKWTRKAMPMMATMMFVRPGKMTVYPKAMNTLSNELTNTDIAEDKNGLAPNFTGIAPMFVQQLWGYQISEENDKSVATSLRVATPQMDALGSLSNPVGTGATLLNPLIKTPIELAKGDTIGDDIGVSDFDYQTRDSWTDVLKTLIRPTPQGNFASKGFGENEFGKQEEWNFNDKLSFLSGLGFYNTFLPDEPITERPESESSNRPVGRQNLKRLLGGGSRP